jgi:ATP-dependent helicase/nuclease subunit B
VVFVGFSPQLTLEAAMLTRGAFKGLPAAPECPELIHVHSSGGRKPFEPSVVQSPRGESRSVAEVAEEHLRQLAGLMGRYVAGRVGFTSRPYPQYARAYAPYDHLARVKEWSATSGSEAGVE